MRNVKVTRTVKLAMTAADWQLYSGMKGVEEATIAMNREIEKVINDNPDDRRGVEFGCRAILGKYGKWGANDSEPWHVLDYLLEEVFGDEK